MAAGTTFTPIATQTLGSSQSSYTFSSIPSTYTDLIIVAAIKNNSGDGASYMQVNGDTGTNYNSTVINGDGTSATSVRQSSTGNGMLATRCDATNFWINTVQIQNYANTSTYKSALWRNNDGSYVVAGVGVWRSTAAISSVTLYPNGASYVAGSTFTLYGILAA